MQADVMTKHCLPSSRGPGIPAVVTFRASVSVFRFNLFSLQHVGHTLLLLLGSRMCVIFFNIALIIRVGNAPNCQCAIG